MASRTRLRRLGPPPGSADDPEHGNREDDRDERHDLVAMGVW